VIYFFYIDKKIILTNAFIKKSPKDEKELAHKYRSNFLKKNNKEILASLKMEKVIPH